MVPSQPVPMVSSPAPAPVMVQPAPTTIMVAAPPPPNIVYTTAQPTAAAPNLMMAAPAQPAMAQPMMAAAPQPMMMAAQPMVAAQPAAPQAQVSGLMLNRPGPIRSAIGALGRRLARVGQPTIEITMVPQVMSMPQPVAAQAPQPVYYAPVSEQPNVCPNCARPSPQSEGYRHHWFGH
jgi:hypothetical protein